MERVVTVKGHRVRYLAAGSGRALVLLHGLGESPADCRGRSLALTVAVGCAHQPCPGFDGQDEPADASAEGYARFLGRFLDAVGVERAAVVGHSLGGAGGVAVHPGVAWTGDRTVPHR
jgi:pimeloyl-ACP methyl ester carboxylesterase